MKAFTKLNLGFANAENYRLRANKELFSKYFVRDEYLEKLLNPNVYFLIGEKGTGKTAYSTYLANNKYKDKNAFTFDVRQTEYQKFMELKKLGHLPLSKHSEVWIVLFLLLAATSIVDSSSGLRYLQEFRKINALKQAIDEFYTNAFSPEILKVMDFIESSDASLALLAKYLGSEIKLAEGNRMEFKQSTSNFQTNLLNIRINIQSILSSLKLSEDYIIFIDGLDVRPSDIEYNDYFSCVRGVIEAIWSINTDFLANIKDSKGRIRFVVLVRPDIFLNSGLHNPNTKIRDNSVLLNWMTTYKDYRSSSLFSVADRMLAVQNDEEVPRGGAWDYYFPFHGENIKYLEGADDAQVSSFLSFLRFSYYRPRDINAMMVAMQQVLSRKGDIQQVHRSDFDDPTFRDAHADYLLGEIRDQLLFYYNGDDYELFLKFFQYLNGKKKFSYDDFVVAFEAFIGDCSRGGVKLPIFFDSADNFLQFLYDQNIICFIEMDADKDNVEKFIRWCFRERTLSNLSPKVRSHAEYEIFYGLTKALNVGRPVRPRSVADKREIGTVIVVKDEGSYGFIRGGSEHRDYYFQFREVDGVTLRVGDKVTYEPIVKYGKLRAVTVRRS